MGARAPARRGRRAGARGGSSLGPGRPSGRIRRRGPGGLEAALAAIEADAPVEAALEAVAAAARAADPRFVGAFSSTDPARLRSSFPVPPPAGITGSALEGAVAEALDRLVRGEGSDSNCVIVTVAPGGRAEDRGSFRFTLFACVDRWLPKTLGAGRGAIYVLGAFVYRGDEPLSRRSVESMRLLRSFFTLHLARQTTALDLGCHRRALELVNALHSSLLQGPLTPLGLNRILSTLEEIVPIDVLVLALPVRGGVRTIFRMSPGTPASLREQISEQIAFVLDTGRRARIVETEHVIRPARRARRTLSATIESSILLPLGRRQARGVLGLFAAAPNRLSPQDMRLLGMLLPSLTGALSSARFLFEAQEGRRRVDEELELAREVQSHLRPRDPIEIDGLEIGHAVLPAGPIGGDLVDVIELPDGRAGIVVADVSGKGIAAALVMSLARGVLRGSWQDVGGPAEVMRRLEDGIAPDLEEGRFVTAGAVLIDPGRRWVTYALAGHEPILHVRGQDGRIEELCTDATPLGIGIGPRPVDERLELSKGDLLVLLTDGVVECLGAGGRRFGPSRLRAAIERGRPCGARGVVDEIVRSLERFRGREPLSDDATVVVVRVGG